MGLKDGLVEVNDKVKRSGAVGDVLDAAGQSGLAALARRLGYGKKRRRSRARKGRGPYKRSRSRSKSRARRMRGGDFWDVVNRVTAPVVDTLAGAARGTAEGAYHGFDRAIKGKGRRLRGGRNVLVMPAVPILR